MFQRFDRGVSFWLTHCHFVTCSPSAFVMPSSAQMSLIEGPNSPESSSYPSSVAGYMPGFSPSNGLAVIVIVALLFCCSVLADARFPVFGFTPGVLCRSALSSLPSR